MIFKERFCYNKNCQDLPAFFSIQSRPISPRNNKPVSSQLLKNCVNNSRILQTKAKWPRKKKRQIFERSICGFERKLQSFFFVNDR
jgi:hypothetical protein